MKYSTLLFDLDGTLTDPGLGITNGILYALRHIGAPLPPREELYQYIGPPLRWTFGEHMGYPPAQVEEMIAAYRAYFKERGMLENHVYPGIPQLLEELVKAGKKLVLATNKLDVHAQGVLRAFSLHQYFDFIAGGDWEATRNTKGKVIAYALQQCGELPSSCVMIGDRGSDMEGARENGMPCIGVSYGYGSCRELISAGAGQIAHTVKELRLQLLR